MEKFGIAFVRTAPGDEGVSIVHVSDAEQAKSPDELASKYVPNGFAWHKIDIKDLPARDEYRNAWSFDGADKKVKPDMAKAREIHKTKLREMRVPKLAALDVEYQKADEADDKVKKKEIAAKRQALRDVTSLPEIEAAADIATLKAIKPAILT